MKQERRGIWRGQQWGGWREADGRAGGERASGGEALPRAAQGSTHAGETTREWTHRLVATEAPGRLRKAHGPRVFAGVLERESAERRGVVRPGSLEAGGVARGIVRYDGVWERGCLLHHGDHRRVPAFAEVGVRVHLHEVRLPLPQLRGEVAREEGTKRLCTRRIASTQKNSEQTKG